MHHIIVCLLLIVTSIHVHASVPPKKKNVHIEFVYDMPTMVNAMGATYTPAPPYTYFMLLDLYSGDERKIGSLPLYDGVASMDFRLDRPLYDEAIRGKNIHIPFYVEPGDSLIIYMNKSGRAQRYRRKDGGVPKYERLMLHDISNTEFYNAQEFAKDVECAHYAQFVNRVLAKMHNAVDSVNRNADRYAFSDEERRIAVNNTKMQFAIWLFEYASYKSGELFNFSSNHNTGWQAMPQQDNAIDEIENVRSYSFVRELPLTDSTCMASRHFPQFIMCYEHAHVLNHDQYLYHGTTLQDKLRMDSAFVSKDMAMTGLTAPSLFMDVAMQRRNYVEEPLPDDDSSIRLKEVNVLGQRSRTYNLPLTPQEMLAFKLNNRPRYNFLSPSYWFGGRKHEKNLQRAKDLIKKLEEEDALKEAERDAIMKAYEEGIRSRK